MFILAENKILAVYGYYMGLPVPVAEKGKELGCPGLWDVTYFGPLVRQPVSGGTCQELAAASQQLGPARFFRRDYARGSGFFVAL